MLISIFKFDPQGQFQGQNIDQKVIIPKFTQISKICQIWIHGFFSFSKIPYFSRLDH